MALDGKVATEFLPLFDRLDIQLVDSRLATCLLHLPLGDNVIHNRHSLGLVAEGVFVSFSRHYLDCTSIVPDTHVADTPNEQRVSIAVLVLICQRPSNGYIIFLMLEDERSISSIVVLGCVFEYC